MTLYCSSLDCSKRDTCIYANVFGDIDISKIPTKDGICNNYVPEKHTV